MKVVERDWIKREGTKWSDATAGDEKNVPKPSERRRFPRFDCLPEVSVGLQRGARARLLDLGLGGALVESATRLLPGSVTAIRFAAPDATFLFKAQISRAFVCGFAEGAKGETSPLYRAGLEFGPMSASELAALSAFITGAASPHTEAQGMTKSDAVLVSIRFPPGWTVTRRRTAVVARAPGEGGYLLLGAPQAPQGVDLDEFARASMQAAGFSVLHCEATEINGLRACVGFYTGWLDEVGAAIIEAAYVVLDSQAYLIAGVAPWASYERVRHEFFATINSFGRLPGTDDASLVEPVQADSSLTFDFSNT